MLKQVQHDSEIKNLTAAQIQEMLKQVQHDSETKNLTRFQPTRNTKSFSMNGFYFVF
jgi:hypothetical protein